MDKRTKGTMVKKKVLIIIGTRPEAIKLAPIVAELKRRSDWFVHKVCVTAQHREMLDQVLELFGIKPDYDLDIMKPCQTLADVTSEAIRDIDGVVRRELPDVILVQGDTTTAFCGALAAHYNKIRVGHVEAGLRTRNKFAPFPEEINRRLISTLADDHFAPTEHAKKVLLMEGIPDSAVHVTGNTVIDALLWACERVRTQRPNLPENLSERLQGKMVVLVTGHRRESFGEGFENICLAIRDIADTFKKIIFVYPVHLNPNVREPVNRILGGHDRILLMGPLPYLPFVWLMDRSTIVLTDSGGVQEEAPSLGKPVLVMRETTERPEGVAVGNAMLVGVRRERIAGELAELLRNPERRASMASVNNPYGDGKASARIADIIA